MCVHESLYYGLKLDHSLINPKQLRCYGMQSKNNPYNRHNGIYIIVSDDLIIDMQSQGTKYRFEPRVHTKEEVLSCGRIIMTNLTEWNSERVAMQEINARNRLHPLYLFNKAKDKYKYDNIHMDETMLHEIEHSLTNLRERVIFKITVTHISTLKMYLQGTYLWQWRDIVTQRQKLSQKISWLAKKMLEWPY